MAVNHKIDIMADMPTPQRRPWTTVDAYLADTLAADPRFRAQWDAEVLARAFGLAVLRHRSAHGLTQSALGRQLGMPQSQIARIEDGEHNPTFPTMLRICDALGLELHLEIGPSSDDRRATAPLRDGIREASDRVVVSIRPARPRRQR